MWSVGPVLPREEGLICTGEKEKKKQETIKDTIFKNVGIYWCYDRAATGLNGLERLVWCCCRWM